MLFQIREVAFDDLPPLVLVRQARLDAAQRLRDRKVFLIEPLEATVDLVEVSEHLAAQLGDPGVHRVDPPTELAKLMGDLAKPPVDLVEAQVHPVEALVDLGEALVHLGEALVHLGRWVKQGRLKYREDIAQGIAAAPQAFIGMLRGKNQGKQLVQLSEIGRVESALPGGAPGR